MADFDRESMLEMFSFEMNQLVDQLEQTIIESEAGFSMDLINEVFRIMHTIKGSAAMMLFDSIATATHAAEDLFYYLREENPQDINYSELTDYVLACMDFIKEELNKIEQKTPADGNPAAVVADINGFLARIKNPSAAETPVISMLSSTPVDDDSYDVDTDYPFASHKYRVKIRFDDQAQPENLRAFDILNNISDYAVGISYEPSDINTADANALIRADGFVVLFSSEFSYEQVHDTISDTAHIKDIFLEEFSADGSADSLNNFYVHLRFDEGAQMENVRAYNIVHGLQDETEYMLHIPEDLLGDEAGDIVRSDGLKIHIITTKSYEEIHEIMSQTIYMKELLVKEYIQANSTERAGDEMESSTNVMAPEKVVTEVQETVTAPSVPAPYESADQKEKEEVAAAVTASKKATGQAVISVNVNKLDQLFKFMGELVIAETMVTKNPELEGLQLESFHKQARQLNKIITDVKDTVLAMRMISLSNTFMRMNRIVRDMCKALNKEAVLEIEGADTEVDKNIIEHIGDPLMHIVRNSLDHGIESPEQRRAAGKPEKGTLRLEARNLGSEVWIVISDDGAGLDRDKILAKAKSQGLLRKPESDYSDKEIFQFIFMPGFSTNDAVTSYSGRGVGMDVVNKNLEFINGTVLVDSIPGEGSQFTLKIPLTLAIIKGMIINVAGERYTIPISSIRDSFRPNVEDIFIDPSGNEMVTVRGDHYNVVRLHDFFGLTENVHETSEGIMMIIENGDDAICAFVNELIGEQQIVAKPIPKYIKKVRGISNCTLLGNGDISFIIDVAGLFDR